MNPNHPHRLLIVQALKSLSWASLFEIGCGAGANLVSIVANIPNIQVGGTDINPGAIAFAQTQLQHALLKVGRADDIIRSDKSCDVVLSDMFLIYVTPNKMKKQLDEIKRIARNYVVLCEFHSDSWWQRLVTRWKEGYNVYNWKKLLEKHDFYSISTYKIPKEFWPESTLQQKYCHIIIARVPNYYV